MKAKLLFLLAGLALSGFVMNGCYTQVARPDRDDETTVSREEEYTEEETEEAQASDTQREDIRHHTDVYIYGGSWYDSWYSPWYSSWYRYPRSRFYFSIGYGYDPWGWCGTAWDWGYDPWCGTGYYGGYRGSYYRGWRSAYYYDPFYRHYPSYVTRDRVVESKKRPTARRGLTKGSDQSTGTYVSGGGGSLLRPASGTYARGTDGTYRRVRKGDATNDRTIGNDQNSAQPARGNREINKRGTRDAGAVKRAATPPEKASGSNQGSVRRTRKPAPSSGDSYTKPRSGSSSKGSSGSGGSVSKPSGGGSSSGGSAPKSSGGSSSGRPSSKRPSRN
jgi:hypothetical protein